MRSRPLRLTSSRDEIHFGAENLFASCIVAHCQLCLAATFCEGETFRRVNCQRNSLQSEKRRLQYMRVLLAYLSTVRFPLSRFTRARHYRPLYHPPSDNFYALSRYSPKSLFALTAAACNARPYYRDGARTTARFPRSCSRKKYG